MSGATMDPCLIVLAAGRSRRFGTPKQLASVHGESLLRRAARHAAATGLPVIVVLGAHAPSVRAVLDSLPLEVIVNPAWIEGMGSSIACGMRQMQTRRPDCSGVLICLADQPLVDTNALNRLLDAHRRAPERIICADHGAVCGPPCLFPRGMFASLARLHGHRGARSVLRRHASSIDTMPMPAAARDIDTVDDLDHVRAHLARHE